MTSTREVIKLREQGRILTGKELTFSMTDVYNDIRSMHPKELERLRNEVEKEWERARVDPLRNLPNGAEGSPKDALVQKLAVEALRALRFGKRIGPQKMTLEEIGARYGPVSGERVRRLINKLMPFEAAEDRKK